MTKPVSKRITVYLEKESYNKLRSRLFLAGKSFSSWMRGKIEEEILNVCNKCSGKMGIILTGDSKLMKCEKCGEEELSH